MPGDKFVGKDSGDGPGPRVLWKEEDIEWLQLVPLTAQGRREGKTREQIPELIVPTATERTGRRPCMRKRSRPQ